MTTNIDDLLKQSKKENKEDEAEGVDDKFDSKKGSSPVSAAGDKQEELQSKMSEIKRRDLELETLSRARSLGVGYLSLQGVSIAPDILQQISEHEALNKKVVCFYYVPYQEMRLGSPTPQAPGVIEIKERMAERHHTPVKLYLLSHDSYEEGLAQYKKLPHIRPVVQKVEITPADLEKFSDIKGLTDLPEMLKKANASELIIVIISAAIKLNTSDIHIESEEHSVELRYRIDGILQDAASLDKELYRTISSRIKLLSKLKINVNNRPQDGHFVIEMPDGKIDVRVSTLPTNYGESIVMRVLRSDITRLKIKDLGLNDYNYAILDKEFRKSNGLLIVTGPTGSGKTTSLYAILGELNSKEVKVLTIEDPIEYELTGINQSQVNPEASYTFAVGLRSLVRQDPDIILVGEMRDDETVEIAINAALTGHMVLSTIHTNDAAGAIPRFLSLGAKPYLLAPALNTVIAQRLVRVLCPDCKQPVKLDSETATRVNKIIQDMPEAVRNIIPGEQKYFAPQGCTVCHGLGYKGRTGIFEIFTMTPPLEDAVLKGEMSSVAIKQLLDEQGMLTMTQDGILKTLAGETSVDEVFRVIQEA